MWSSIETVKEKLGRLAIKTRKCMNPSIVYNKT